MKAMRIWQMQRGVPVGPILLALAAAFALLLALPGQTVATKYLNDLFVLLDSAYRVAGGQVPNRDFHTILGPLASYVRPSAMASPAPGAARCRRDWRF
jgi:hypothetical protein